MKLKKMNYKAWGIKEDMFPSEGALKDQLLFLSQYGILAPSSHNTQPWFVEVVDGTLTLSVNMERALPVADKDNRLLFVSLGCVLENILTASDYFGFKTNVEYFPHEYKSDVVVIVHFENEREVRGGRDHRLFSIPDRQTNRNKYRKDSPNESFMIWLKGLSTDGLEMCVVEEKEKRKKIANILFHFRELAFGNKSFRKELSNYKRTNFTRSGTGIPGFTMGFSTLFSLVAPFVIRHVNVMKFIKKSEKELLVEHTPVFVFVNTKNDTKSDWLHVGQIFQRVALEAEKNHIQTAINAVPLQLDQIKQILQSDFKPQLFFRIGYAIKYSGHSPRLAMSEFIK